MNENRGLWRGKRIDDNSEHNGEWVEGFYFREMGDFIKEPPSSVSTKTYLVDPSTLGECTGLTNKNGKLIFEGDIVKYYPLREDCAEIGYIKWNKTTAGFIIKLLDGAEDGICKVTSTLLRCEIIGNIHDNLELLMNATGEDIGNATQDTIASALGAADLKER